MLHLAQVTKNPQSGATELQLLARQQPNRQWLLDSNDRILCEEAIAFNEGVLVLIELGENEEISDIQSATDWIISLIRNHLTAPPLSSDFYQAEQVRIEQWRQEMTAKSLDLTRRHLELETHQERIQELEAQLKQEQERLELRWQQLQSLEAKYQADGDRRL
jgi:hypothetical protein